jgi:hypothetical protein
LRRTEYGVGKEDIRGFQTSENFETNKEGAKRTLEVSLKLFAEGREGAMSLFALLVSARAVQYDEKGLWHEFWNPWVSKCNSDQVWQTVF